MKLNKTIERLTNKPTNSVTIINMDTAEKVICNVTGKTLMEEYGTIENYFENLYKKGITKIKVSDRNPHGSTTTPCGEPYTVSLIPQGNNEPKEKAVEMKTNYAETPRVQTQGLNGGLEGYGMNAAQVELAGKMFNYPTLVADLQTYKSKADRLEEENAALKTKILIAETLDEKGAKSTEANTGYLAMAKDLVKEFAPVIMSMKGGANQDVPALAGVSSPVMQETLKALSQFDDATIQLVGKFVNQLNQDAVWTDFDQMLTKHNIE